MDQTFATYWAAIEPEFSEVQPVLMLAFKELAEKAWDNGFNAGWDVATDAYGWKNGW